jgi:hypothetical protein
MHSRRSSNVRIESEQGVESESHLTVMRNAAQKFLYCFYDILRYYIPIAKAIRTPKQSTLYLMEIYYIWKII